MSLGVTGLCLFVWSLFMFSWGWRSRGRKAEHDGRAARLKGEHGGLMYGVDIATRVATEMVEGDRRQAAIGAREVGTDLARAAQKARSQFTEAEPWEGGGGALP